MNESHLRQVISLLGLRIFIIKTWDSDLIDHGFTQQTAKSGCWEVYAQGPDTEAQEPPSPPIVETIYLPLVCCYHFPGSQTL